VKLTALILACMALSGCTRPLVGGLAICIMAECTITYKPDQTQSAAEKIGGGLAQIIYDKYRDRQN
jgi:hypothetical protein